MSRVLCPICPHRCMIREGEVGLCGARGNQEGKIVPLNYGNITSIALDPIEKKPLARFHPGSTILSVGSYGCNFHCSFCQNFGISMEWKQEAGFIVTPRELVDKAHELKDQGNIGLAYTYNEPLIGYEFVYDSARLATEEGLQNVVVTNGYVEEAPLRELLPYVQAFNIDLKSFSERFYHTIGGSLADVKRSIAIAAEKSHVEVTTLIIPGENDTEEEMEALATWLASVDPSIPLHVSRFFPAYKMREKEATRVERVIKLANIARRHLQFVYEGNIY